MDLDLRDRVVVITAAGSGIGLACAEAFVAEGARVVAGDLRPPRARSDGAGTLLPVELDLLAADGPGRLVERAVAAFGRVDVLVNNLGGVVNQGSFLDLSDDDWQRTLNLNFFGMVRACRAALPHMVRQKDGAIVSIASDAGRVPDPFYLDYCVAKAAVISLAKSVAAEFGAHNIRSNWVSPGPTRTPGLVSVFENTMGPRWGMSTEQAIDHFAKNLRHIPLGALGDPSDVAAAVLFLSSRQAKHVTGSEYRVDGGVVRTP